MPHKKRGKYKKKVWGQSRRSRQRHLVELKEAVGRYSGGGEWEVEEASGSKLVLRRVDKHAGLREVNRDLLVQALTLHTVNMTMCVMLHKNCLIRRSIMFYSIKL